ncbi:hypothetical protein LCGC14_1837290 [marine sediment metagenome]|uniref:Uncharacterized protein n=1 Tax=marine sediment metagenome TaxID=412755 RepID=A0A0F9GE97_9ZZZZ
MTRSTTDWPHLLPDPYLCIETRGWCFNIFGGGSPAAPAPLPPVPTFDDPAIEARRRKLKSAEARRRGRRSTQLTGGQGVLGDAPVVRPQLTGNLGG